MPQAGSAGPVFGSALLALVAATAQAQTPAAPVPVTTLPTTEVIGTSPLIGSGIDRDKVPSATRSISAGDLTRNGSPNLPSGLNDRIGSVFINETQDNVYQPDIQYRGFTASPLGGTPQGLAVYQNGVRINEAFGDTVNWDVIPDRAIDRTNLVSSNPVFGLNALGGAIALEMKNGFTYQGSEIELLGGSFGRRSIEGEYGVQVGNFAAYVAAGGAHDDGWRDFSPSEVRNLYADIGMQFGPNREGELHFSVTGANNRLTGNGTAPVELLELRRESIFTFPDQTKNKVGMLSLNGSYRFDPTLSLQAVAYLRRFRQNTTNGDLFEAEACDDDVSDGNLCLEDDDGPVLLDGSGNPIADFLGDAAPGAFNRTSTSSTGVGGSVQLTRTAELLGHGNHLVVGVSYDHANTTFGASTEIGTLTADRGVDGSGLIVTSEDGTVTPVGLKSETSYYGIYASNTFDVTNALALTLGARFNIADIRLSDQLGTSLNGSDTFRRFNPAAGLTYKILPTLTAYAGYAEANRAPTPAELSCADVSHPCTLANFFVADPPLKQVVTHTYEAGLRGGFDLFGGADRATWNVGLFRTDSDDDIINVASPIQGRGFFQNAGTTRRQGLEAGATYRSNRWSLYADYALVDATFRDDLVLNSPNNPVASPDGTIAVTSGDHLPGIPEHRLKLGADFSILPEWKVGATMIYASGQYLRGDESNQNPKISGYKVVNLNTSYRVLENFEIFGVIQNLFDEKYATFGAFSDLEGITFSEGAVTDPRAVSPGAPRAFYAGLRARF
jgi:outer membrane receptor protein involved in Fe transport